MSMRLLLIEDDKDMALSVKADLNEFYIVDTAYTGEEGLSKISHELYDLIILDYLLPDTDGIRICAKIRKKGITTPILMLTGENKVSYKIKALNEGADDYLLKPFDMQELLARIRAILRRSPLKTNSSVFQIRDLSLDVDKKVVIRAGKVIKLRRKEMYLLEYLTRNIGKVVTREMIFDHVWHNESESLTNTVDVHIKYLRDQIDKDFEPKLIKTVHGIGYKLEG